MTSLPSISSRAWRALCALVAATALAAGCGGGGGTESGVGAGGTGSPLSFSQGPITGFGSIIVNGVHFDDSGASVVDDDGNALSNSQSLRLGTVVDVQGGAIANGAATASAIHVHLDLVGTVTTALDATSGRLAVLGQPVRVLSTTALDGFSGGAAAIPLGAEVAVSSLYDRATGVYVATRIDPVPNAPRFAIRGVVAAIDTERRHVHDRRHGLRVCGRDPAGVVRHRPAGARAARDHAGRPGPLGRHRVRPGRDRAARRAVAAASRAWSAASPTRRTSSSTASAWTRAAPRSRPPAATLGRADPRAGAGHADRRRAGGQRGAGRARSDDGHDDHGGGGGNGGGDRFQIVGAIAEPGRRAPDADDARADHGELRHGVVLQRRGEPTSRWASGSRCAATCRPTAPR